MSSTDVLKRYRAALMEIVAVSQDTLSCSIAKEALRKRHKEGIEKRRITNAKKFGQTILDEGQLNFVFNPPPVIPINGGPDEPLASDLLWGAAAIAGALGRDRRCVYYALINGDIPAGQIGRRWVASKKALREHFVRLARGGANAG